ncbi:MAG: hypothetical protein QW638_03580 [Candidatus Bathyarchaeia archaeon]|nr:hypothetical protein [Candidatus Bathyarchaeota archaeon]
MESHYDYYLLELVGTEDEYGARGCIKKICRSIPYWKKPERNHSYW